MKKILAITFLFSLLLIGGIYFSKTNSNEDYLRIHIRANSNLYIDQNVKYKVKDCVVEALIPYISECETKQECEDMILSKLDFIESVANNVLKANGFSYTAKASVRNEEFPTRQYDELVLESGFYDALILELGTGEGDNWWCVVYPPLCFVNGGAENVVYKSKILEIIKNVLG